MLTRQMIQRIAPRPTKAAAKAKIWDAYVEALTSPEFCADLPKAGIVKPAHLAMALAQWKHECAGFTIVWESGAYRAQTILKIFGVGKHSAKVTSKEAVVLAAKCKVDGGYALFERVYGLGNPRKAAELGNIEVGDGFNYRGLGIVQLTGRRDHERFAAKLGITTSELLLPINLCRVALLEWKDKNLSACIDRGGDVCFVVSKKINGGTNGLAERRQYYAQALKIVPKDVFDTESTIAAIAKADPASRAAINAGIPPEALPAPAAKGPVMADLEEEHVDEDAKPSKMAVMADASRTFGGSKTIWSIIVGAGLWIMDTARSGVDSLRHGIETAFDATPDALAAAKGQTSLLQDLGSTLSINVGSVLWVAGLGAFAYAIWRHFALKHEVNKAK